jgi:signal transduction histidine kinase/ligand-binding sensor domain-containing protein
MIVPRRTRSILPSLAGRRVLLPSLFAVSLSLLATAAKALPADRAVSQYVRHSWTVEQGLPHDTVRGLAQTADGYLWLATYEGLVRFNGEKFRILDRSSSPGIQSNSLTTLCRTGDDTLWLGTLAGLMRYRDGSFQTVLTQGGINALAAAPDGSVWVGTAGGVLTHIVRDRPEVVHLPLPAGPITALAATRDGLWVGTSRGLAHVTGGNVDVWTTARGLANDTIVTLAPDGDDALLVGTASGLDRIAAGHLAQIPGLPADQVTALRRDRDGNLWIGTYGNGLFRFAGDQLSAYGIGDGLLNPTVRAIFEDDEGSLWIGSNGGLEQLRVGAFVTWNKRDGLADAVARVIFEDHDGVLWAGTANGLNRWENGAWKKVDDSRLARILSMAQSRDGTRWFGTANGVFRVKDGKTSLVTTEEGLSNNTIRAIHEDVRGDVWLGTDFGLDRIRPDGTVESFAGRGGLGNDYAMAIAETPDGRVWFATGGGLAEWDGAVFRLHSAPRDLPSNRLFALVAEADGTIWITTDGEGLLRYRGGKAKAITTRQGLLNDKILSLVDDGKGALWFGTVRGAFTVPKRDLNAVANGTAPRIFSRMFDENDGLGSRQCNGIANPSALRSHDGRIWFVTANGVSALTASRAPALPVRVPVVERVVVDGREATPAKLEAIPPGMERIEFEFSGVTSVTPERLRLRYRLDGYGDGWVEAGANHVASYTNLRAGDYRFILESSRDGNNWRTTALPFALRPHFYETSWFIALCIVLVAALLMTVHNVRLRLADERARLLETLVEERTHQISEEKERTEVALRAAEVAKREAEAATREAERHERLTEEALAQAETANRTKSIFLATTSHELRTPLNAIIGFSEILLSHASEQLDPRHARFLQNIHSSGQYLLGHINNILDLSKIEAGRIEIQPETILLHEVVDEICAVMKGVATLRDITIDIEIAEDLPLEADPTQVRQILYNLMSNAVKFSPEHATVTVAARHLPSASGLLRDETIEIRVSDQGIGIDPAEHQLIFQEFRQAHGPRGYRPEGTGLGLALVKRFVEMHGGTIRVESSHGKGSTFVVVMPCRYRPGAAAEVLREDVVGKV